jgi:hypothetical protein
VMVCLSSIVGSSSSRYVSLSGVVVFGAAARIGCGA